MRTSLLTAGLDDLGNRSHTIQRMLKELYALDDTLQAAHQEATRNDEFGEDVVRAYEAFLGSRERLIEQLTTEGVPVPWQLRMRIDDIELTLRQRKEKLEEGTKSHPRRTSNGVNAEGDSSSTTRRGTTVNAHVSSAATVRSSSPEAAPGTKEPEDPFLILKAMILPSLLVAIIAAIAYGLSSLEA